MHRNEEAVGGSSRRQSTLSDRKGNSDKTAVCSVFRYSAGFVDWTRTELDDISKVWVRAYKQAWTLSGSIDSSPMMLCVEDGGRGCPSAVDLWTCEVYEVLEQCVGLPGEI